jgi:hypothetical protein
MNTLEECGIECPYCGALQTVLIDCSIDEQAYVEDCQVCCQPILFRVRCDAGGLCVEVLQENG